MSGAHGPRTHLILGRGGVRGIAIAGAVCRLQGEGYHFEKVAGISAGGIVAALVAAGYCPEELRRLLWTLDFRGLLDASGAGRVPLLGPAWRLATRLGVYDGDVLLRLLRRLLAAKGVRTFADLAAADGGWRLQLVAADVSRGRLVVLPDQAPEYGLDPGDLEVALALRMTAGLPLLFRPVRIGPGAGSVMVDGGLLAGIPFALFDWAGDGDMPTIAIQAGPGASRRRGRPIRGPLALARASYYTALTANQDTHRSLRERDGTIDIDCGDIAATRFRLGDGEKAALFEAGARAAEAFVASHPRQARPERVPAWAVG